MVHGGSRGGSSRAHAYAHIICVPCFFEKQVFRADGKDLKGGNDGKSGNGGPGLSERNGNYGTVSKAYFFESKLYFENRRF